MYPIYYFKFGTIQCFTIFINQSGHLTWFSHPASVWQSLAQAFVAWRWLCCQILELEWQSSTEVGGGLPREVHGNHGHFRRASWFEFDPFDSPMGQWDNGTMGQCRRRHGQWRAVKLENLDTTEEAITEYSIPLWTLRFSIFLNLGFVLAMESIGIRLFPQH